VGWTRDQGPAGLAVAGPKGNSNNNQRLRKNGRKGLVGERKNSFRFLGGV
jgi:hypothetical protein